MQYQTFASKIAPALLAIVAFAGCANPGKPPALSAPANAADLLSVLANTATPDDSRKAADQRLVQAKSKTDETRLSILEQIVFAPGHSDAMRIYALDQLAEADPARAGKTLALYLPRMDGSVLDHACELAAKLGDTRVTESLLVSLARAVEDDDAGLGTRPEIGPIESLSGKPLNDALLNELRYARNENARVAALDVLRVRLGEDSLIGRLTSLKSSDDFLRELQLYLADFLSVPRGANEVSWARQLERNPALKTAARERHALLKSESDYIFAPRFAATLAHADDAALQVSRAQLLADLKSRLADHEHVRREPDYKGSPEDFDESLDANEKKLSRADLLALRLILRALNDPTTITELHRQGVDDMSDTTSEHGGLLAIRGGGAGGDRKILPVPYLPMFTDNDFQYVTGDKLVRDTFTGLAQYHFHFQQVNNSQRAGPGAGDLAYVKHARCNALVITSVGTRKFDIDFYTPAGAVIDLGIYEAK